MLKGDKNREKCACNCPFFKNQVLVTAFPLIAPPKSSKLRVTALGAFQTLKLCHFKAAKKRLILQEKKKKNEKMLINLLY